MTYDDYNRPNPRCKRAYIRFAQLSPNEQHRHLPALEIEICKYLYGIGIYALGKLTVNQFCSRRLPEISVL
jgi:hypothetical protein